jgi:hypothetical protein
MPLVVHVNSIGRFFDAMGERGNRYTYDGAQFILDYYNSPDYGAVQLDPISIVSMFREYHCLRDYCEEVYNGDADLIAAAKEYVDLDDELLDVLAKVPDDQEQLKASILQASYYRKDILAALENNREFSTQKNYDGTPYMLANGSIMFVCA